MKITIFDGTPEEFKLVANVIGNNSIAPSVNENGSVSIKEAYRAVLKRALIHNGQRNMYNVLANGELHWNEYNKLMKRTPQQIRGVHGALGKRINQTPEIHKAGLPGNLNAVLDWNIEEKTIGLKPEFLEVLKEEGII
jgi:hypothetical protein